jgi:hypothetical protein
MRWYFAGLWRPNIEAKRIGELRQAWAVLQQTLRLLQQTLVGNLLS